MNSIPEKLSGIEEQEETKVDLELSETLPTSTTKKFKNEFIDIAARLVAAGFTEKDLSYVFKCAPLTIETWKKRYPEFAAACEDGKRVIKKKIIAAAIRDSVGYMYETSKHKITRNADGKIIKDEEIRFTNRTPSNPQLIMFLLCNIARQLNDNDWASKHTMEMADGGIRIKIEGKLESERIANLAGKLLQDTVQPAKFVESKEVEKQNESR